MRKEPPSYPDKETSPEREGRITTSSGGSSSTQSESPQYPSEASPLNTRGIRKYSAKKNRRDCPDIPFGIMPSNYSQEHPPRYLDDSFPSLRARSPKHKNSWLNT